MSLTMIHLNLDYSHGNAAYIGANGTRGSYVSVYIRHLTDGLAWAPRKAVASCDKPGVGACCLRTQDCRIGLPIKD